MVFAPTLCLLAAAYCWRQRNQPLRSIAHLVCAALLSLSIAAAFYLPYTQRSKFLEVRSYLIERLTDGRGAGTFNDTYTLLGLYFPPYYLLFTVFFLLLGITLLLRKRRDIFSFALILWFVTAFAFYMFLGGDPRSHVYNYFVPGLIITAYGIQEIIAFVASFRVRRLLMTSVWLVVLGFACSVYYMLVDHRVEHPWYGKTILGNPLPNLEDRHIDGVFGFPYRRGLEMVGALFDSGPVEGNV